MAYSTQRAVSDGTLARIELSIDIIEQSDVNVYYDGVVADPTTWSWESPTSNAILFSPIVPLGVEVLLQRSTYMASVLNIFGPDPTRGGNAKFTNATMDENFRQALFIAQEAKEGSSLSDVFSNLNIHGYKLINLGAPTDPSDAVNKAYVDALAPSLAAQVAAAQAAAAAALASQNAAKTSETNSKTSETNAAASASTAATAATNAQAYRDAAQGYRDQAQTAQAAAASSASTASAAATAAGTSETNAGISETQAEYYAGQAATYGGSTPILFTCWFPSRAAIPTGYLPLDGQTFQRSTYPDAAAEIAAGTVPTVADATWVSDPTQRGQYTLGDGSTTCRLPDYNGKYDSNSLAALILRGDGNLSAGTAGAIQRDALQNITGSTGGLFAAGGATGVFTLVGSGTDTWQGAGTVTKQSVSFDASRVARTATETRMSNVTGVYCVKMAGVPINAGTLDLATLTMNMLDRRNNLGDVLDVDAARGNLGLYTSVDISTLSSDLALKPGQSAYLEVSAATTVALKMACAAGQLWRMRLNSSGTSLGGPGNLYLEPNNALVGTSLVYVQGSWINHSTGGISVVSNYGNALMLGQGGVGLPATCEVILDLRTAHKYTHAYAVHPYPGEQRNTAHWLGTASNSNAYDTTTLWTSLGTLVFPSAWTGRVTVTREL